LGAIAVFGGRDAIEEDGDKNGRLGSLGNFVGRDVSEEDGDRNGRLWSKSFCAAADVL